MSIYIHDAKFGKSSHRLVTRNGNGTFTIMFEGTKRACEKFALGRWGHYPPFMAITTRKSNFDRCF